MTDYSKTQNKPSTQRSYRHQIDHDIVPSFGNMKAHEVARADIIALMKRMEKAPTCANRVLSCIRKMFSLAELWGHRPDSPSPCRHIQKYPRRATVLWLMRGKLRNE